jgi:hypothetical protein
VLRVDPNLVFPRQVAEPVLYVGNQTAERINVGYKSGHVVAIVPGPVSLYRDPIWFGTPALPEQVDSNAVLAERAKAEAAAIRATPWSVMRSSMRAYVALADRQALLREVAGLIHQYAPDEAALADSLAPIE